MSKARKAKTAKSKAKAAQSHRAIPASVPVREQRWRASDAELSERYNYIYLLKVEPKPREVHLDAVLLEPKPREVHLDAVLLEPKLGEVHLDAVLLEPKLGEVHLDAAHNVDAGRSATGAIRNLGFNPKVEQPD